MTGKILALILVPILIFSAACIPGLKAKTPKDKVPKWARGVPADDTYIYAVGICGRTLYPTDAIKYATEKARDEMAKMIKTQIVSTVQTMDSQRREDISMESISLTDAEIQGTQFVAKWIDSEGATGVSPGTTYVLIRLERSKYEEMLRKYR